MQIAYLLAEVRQAAYLPGGSPAARLLREWGVQKALPHSPFKSAPGTKPLLSSRFEEIVPQLGNMSVTIRLEI